MPAPFIPNRVRVLYEGFSDAHRILIAQDHPRSDWEKRVEYVTGFKTARDREGGMLVEGTPSWPRHTCQQLYDALHEAGFRYTHGTVEDAAVQKHLSDMRTIAFNRLKIDSA